MRTFDVLIEQMPSCLRRTGSCRTHPRASAPSAEARPMLEVFPQPQALRDRGSKDKDDERKAKRSSSPRRDSLLCRPLLPRPPPPSSLSVHSCSSTRPLTSRASSTCPTRLSVRWCEEEREMLGASFQRREEEEEEVMKERGREQRQDFAPAPSLGRERKPTR